MMKLVPLTDDDPRSVLRAVRAAMHGAGPALGLGMLGSAPVEVRAGTAVVVTTSGSTGVPKSVALSRNALTASALATADRIGDGAWLLALPASYVAGLQVLVRAIVGGREPAILSGVFSPRSFAAAALTMTSSRGGERVPTYTSLVPAQLSRLLDAADDDEEVRRALQSFEAILIGGQALSPTVGERARDVGARIVRSYGSSETSGGCVYDGVPLRDVQVGIVDGEVRVAGPTLADGYLGRPDLTDAAFVADHEGIRWYRTGDAGVMEGGILRVQGRLDNVIISGGINISLDRVERVVRGVPGLEDAVVVGVEDDRWGEASVIAVSRAALGSADEERLRDEARAAVAAELGAPARPGRLVLVDEMPTLYSGKPDRAALRRAIDGATGSATG